MRNVFFTLIKPVLCSLIIVLLGAGFVIAVEIDDSSLFVEAFSAYQKKDYLLAIEKIETLNQLFPDTPLRDVTLLLLAHSGLKSGDNELAALSINRFNNEFPTSPLKAAIEDELLQLGIRQQTGEKLPPAIPLRNAARKTRDERITLADKPGQARLNKQTISQEVIRVAINISDDVRAVAAGQKAEIPFQIVNQGSADETFLLETSAPPEYRLGLKIAGQAEEKRSRITVGTVTPVKGSIMIRMPPDKVDGYKTILSLRAVSEKSPRIENISEIQVITVAPLVRVVTKPEKQKLAPGEKTRYRVTVLNVGMLSAKGLTVRVYLPAQMDFIGPPGSPFILEAPGKVVFNVENLGTGKLAEYIMDVKIREGSSFGQELRCKVEVINNQLQTKEVFTSTAAVIQAY